LVPWIADAVHKGVHLQCSLDTGVYFDVDARVRVIVPVGDDLRVDGLEERVAIGAAALKLVTKAPVVIVFDATVAPEGKVMLEDVVDQLGDGTVNALDHHTQVHADFEVSNGVIVVVEKCCDPGDETEVLRPVIEAIPEDRFRFFGFEGVEAVAHLCGDEVDGVVAIPMLEPVLSVGVLVFGV